jgi:hypothetical protein
MNKVLFEYTDTFEIVRRPDLSDSHNEFAQELLKKRLAYSNVVPIDSNIPEFMSADFQFVPVKPTGRSKE